MHILVLTESFYPEVSGGSHVRTRFSKQLVEMGHEVTVFTPQRKDAPKTEYIDGVKVVRPLRNRPDRFPPYSSFAFLFRIAFSMYLLCYINFFVDFEDVDRIHSTSHLMHWVGKSTAALQQIPYVNFVGYTPSVEHDPDLSYEYVLEQINFRLFMGDVVFCRTGSTKSAIQSHCDADVRLVHGILNVEKIETAMDDSSSREHVDIPDDVTVLAYVGRFSPLKNPEGAIDVLSRLPADYELVLVGDGPQRQAVNERVRHHGLEERVHMTGKLPHEETLSLLTRMDALLLTSHVEAYPTVVFESLAIRKPIFTRPVGILRDIDHSRLHLGTLQSLPQVIKQTDIEQASADQDTGLDDRVIEQFSVRRYTNTIADAFMNINES